MQDRKMKERFLNGYRLIHKPEHPTSMKSRSYNGFIYEHVYKAEMFMGRPLRKNENVHHMNGNRLDNRKENLLVLEGSQHTKLHGYLAACASSNESAGMKAVNSGKPKIRYCVICGLCLDEHQKKCCSMECSRFSVRKVSRPTEEEIQQHLIEGMSMCAIGRKYGVSDNAVRKWLKSYHGNPEPSPSNGDSVDGKVQRLEVE